MDGKPLPDGGSPGGRPARPARVSSIPRRRPVIALLTAAVLALSATLTPAAAAAAPPAPECTGGSAVLFQEQWYCPGGSAGINRTAYGIGARIVLTDVTVTGIAGTTATVSRCATPGYGCGASIGDSSAAVSLAGISGRPTRGDILDVYGVTATGSLVATGYTRKGHTDLPPTSTDVSLRSMANNRYVVAENAGNAPLIANRTAIGGWEHFNSSTSGRATWRYRLR